MTAVGIGTAAACPPPAADTNEQQARSGPNDKPHGQRHRGPTNHVVRQRDVDPPGLRGSAITRREREPVWLAGPRIEPRIRPIGPARRSEVRMRRGHRRREGENSRNEYTDEQRGWGASDVGHGPTLRTATRRVYRQIPLIGLTEIGLSAITPVIVIVLGAADDTTDPDERHQETEEPETEQDDSRREAQDIRHGIHEHGASIPTVSSGVVVNRGDLRCRKPEPCDATTYNGSTGAQDDAPSLPFASS